MNTSVLQTLTWKTVKYVDMGALEEEFDELKEYLKTEIPLSPVDPGHPLKISTDG